MKTTLLATAILASVAIACPTRRLFDTTIQIHMSATPTNPESALFVAQGDTATPIAKSTVQELQDAVTNDYLRDLGSDVRPTWYNKDFTSTKVAGDWINELCIFQNNNIVVPAIQSCTPRISAVIP